MLSFFRRSSPRLSLLAPCHPFATPLGMLMGLDGAILCGFLIGFPANEAVLPAIVAVYLLESAPPSSSLFQLLSAHRWTWKTTRSASWFSACFTGPASPPAA